MTPSLAEADYRVMWPFRPVAKEPAALFQKNFALFKCPGYLPPA